MFPPFSVCHVFVLSLSFRSTCVSPGLFPSIRTSRLRQALKATDCLGLRHSGPLLKSFWSTCRARTCAQKTCASSCAAAAHHNPEVPTLFLLSQSHDRRLSMRYHWASHIIQSVYSCILIIHLSIHSNLFVHLSQLNTFPSIDLIFRPSIHPSLNPN